LFYSPLFESVAVVAQDEVILWVNGEKVTQGVENHLNGFDCEDVCVQIKEYQDRIADLTAWAANKDGKFLLSKPSQYLSGASYDVYRAVGGEDKVKLGDSPILDDKAEKNAAEAQGMVNAHLKDAYACSK